MYNLIILIASKEKKSRESGKGGIKGNYRK